MTAPKQLKRRAWKGVFLRSLGHASWAAELTATGINFLGSHHQAPFSSWAGPAKITSTLGFTTIEVPLAGGQVARLAGVTTHDAASFISAANKAFSVIRPVTRRPSASHRFRRQNLECPGLIHSVAHRILRMIHAENRPSYRRKIRGVAYPLTKVCELVPCMVNIVANPAEPALLTVRVPYGACLAPFEFAV
ncbi:hypothetical protein Brsp06_04860 [Brucella sp. NBRC 13694]